MPVKPWGARSYGVQFMMDLTDLEGAPFEHPLRGTILAYAVETMAQYAYIKEYDLIRAKNAVNERVQKLYCTQGDMVPDVNADMRKRGKTPGGLGFKGWPITHEPLAPRGRGAPQRGG